MKRIFVFAFICSMSVLAHTEIGAQNWTNEIRNLRTVEIGADFFTNYKECPKRQQKAVYEGEDTYLPGYDQIYKTELKDIACFKDKKLRPVIEGTKRYEVDNLPFIKGAGNSVEVTLINDRVEHIEMKFLNAYREDFYAVIIDKYGKPSSEETNVYKNAYGQTFSGRSLRWNGKSFSLSFDEHIPGMDKDYGVIQMHSQVFLTRAEEWAQARKNRIRKGL